MPVDVITFERAKSFKYRLEINGYLSALVQKVKMPKIEIGVSEHAGGAQNFLVNEAGMLKFNKITLNNVVPYDGAGREFWWKWLIRVQNPVTGNGMRPRDYKYDCSLYDDDPANVAFRVFEFKGAFISSYDPGERNSLAEKEDIIEEVELTFDWVDLRKI